MSSIANIQYKHVVKEGSDIDVTIPPPNISMDKWQFVGFVYNRTLTDPIDVFVKVQLNNREYVIQEYSSSSETDLFYQPELDLSSPLKLNFSTENAGVSENHSVILIYKI